MIVIQNRFADIILMKGYGAVTIWPFLFVNIDMELTPRILNHEEIHARQQLEMLVLPFYLWYLIEWLVRMCINRRTAYSGLSFEREARSYELHPQNRKTFGWIKYLF